MKKLHASPESPAPPHLILHNFNGASLTLVTNQQAPSPEVNCVPNGYFIKEGGGGDYLHYSLFANSE